MAPWLCGHEGWGGVNVPILTQLESPLFRTQRNDPPFQQDFSKWQDNQDEAEGRERTLAVHGLALEGPKKRGRHLHRQSK